METVIVTCDLKEEQEGKGTRTNQRMLISEPRTFHQSYLSCCLNIRIQRSLFIKWT